MAKYAMAMTLLALLAAAPTMAAEPDFDALYKELRQSAADWAQSETPDAPAKKSLPTAGYTPAALPGLEAVIARASAEPSPINVYMVNALLAPLQRAKPQVIAQAMPLVRSAYENPRNRILPFPVYSAKVLTARYADPTGAEATNSTRAAQVERNRREKLAAEKPRYLHNLQAGRLEILYLQLLAKAGDDRCDKELLQRIVELEKKGNQAYAAGIEALAHQAAIMSRPRGKAIYPELHKLGEELKYKKGSYTDYTKPLLKKDDNSTFAQGDGYPGIVVLTALNQVSTAAHEPALVVPTPAEIEHHLDKPPSPKP